MAFVVEHADHETLVVARDAPNVCCNLCGRRLGLAGFAVPRLDHAGMGLRGDAQLEAGHRSAAASAVLGVSRHRTAQPAARRFVDVRR